MTYPHELAAKGSAAYKAMKASRNAQAKEVERLRGALTRIANAAADHGHARLAVVIYAARDASIEPFEEWLAESGAAPALGGDRAT